MAMDCSSRIVVTAPIETKIGLPQGVHERLGHVIQHVHILIRLEPLVYIYLDFLCNFD